MSLFVAQVRDVPFLYVIWSLASLLNHFVCRVFFKPSKLLAHYTLLGYSVTPILPCAAVIVLFHPPVWACTALEAVAVAWASAAAASSYLVVFKVGAWVHPTAWPGKRPPHVCCDARRRPP